MNCDSQISTLEVRLSLPKLLELLASDSSKLSLSVEIPFSQKKLLLPMFYPIAGSSSYPMTGWYSIKILAPIQWNHVKECVTHCSKDGYNCFHVPLQCVFATSLITKRWHLFYVPLNMKGLCDRFWLQIWLFQVPYIKKTYNLCVIPLEHQIKTTLL